MKSVLYLVRRGPGVAADETIDLALVSGVFEQRVSMLFMDDGVYQLVGLDERQSSVKALPTYDIEAIHVSRPSLTERAIDEAEIGLAVQIADSDAIRALLASHDVVVTD